MNPTSEGEEENTFRKQLQNIDKWLSNVTPVQGDSILKNSSNPPNQPITPNSNFNTMDKRLFKKPRFPFKRRFQPSSNQNHITTSSPSSAGNLRIIPIGGFEEVGKNMTVFEYNNDIVVVDMGFQFPEEDMLGIDYVLPDPTYLKEHKNKIRGIFLTHGHLDHIGGIPYLLPQLGFPQVYGTSLTMGFVKKQLEEFKLLNQARLHIFDPKDQFRVGAFNISFFRVNHSIPDSVGIVIECPAGRIVHTGDFKFDFTPLGQLPADFQTIAAIGKKGVDILISDSTNSTEPGHTTSEKVIADNLSEIIRNNGFCH
ncbi:MAG: RNA-metabolising metallo-beta-lactamase, ribonuclease J [Candidatus Peregrinibacteria bacterium GW2011_GWE2_39_6]|nr:MAG: RNA-metabolising metallo-beta-lactamase, ribonuclease J [Candidatus Peregrinibacteria bacterium GW2011_GWE2_39_6]